MRHGNVHPAHNFGNVAMPQQILKREMKSPDPTKNRSGPPSTCSISRFQNRRHQRTEQLPLALVPKARPQPCVMRLAPMAGLCCLATFSPSLSPTLEFRSSYNLTSQPQHCSVNRKNATRAGAEARIRYGLSWHPSIKRARSATRKMQRIVPTCRRNRRLCNAR